MTTYCGWCGKPCKEIGGRTSCCRSTQVFVGISETAPVLTQARINEIAAKIDSNGCSPGTRVFYVSDAPYEDDDDVG